MQYTRYRTTRFFSGYFPPAVKWLLITNIGIFLLQFFSEKILGIDNPFWAFGLVPALVFRGWFWQLATYLFIHVTIWHILWNMLALWFFACDLERDWGTRRFLQYYFLCGIGAGFFVLVASVLFHTQMIPTKGASGAIYGVLLAFGMMYPDRQIIFFIFPMKAKYFVMLAGAIAFIGTFDQNSGVSDVAHLGGMIFGYIYLKTMLVHRRIGFDPVGQIRQGYQGWKQQRARKKFQVYMRKQSGRGPWVN